MTIEVFRRFETTFAPDLRDALSSLPSRVDAVQRHACGLEHAATYVSLALLLIIHRAHLLVALAAVVMGALERLGATCLVNIAPEEFRIFLTSKYTAGEQAFVSTPMVSVSASACGRSD
jgi:hypothetical protein